MFRKVNFQDGQIASEQDFENLGLFPREAFDTILKDIGGWPASRYAGFAVEQIGQSTVRVGSGRLYRSGGVAHYFADEGGFAIDLLDFQPALSKRIATIVVSGNTVNTDNEPREFVINVDDGTTEGREVMVESRRVAAIAHVMGAENPTPVPPTISSDFVAVANVVLTNQGIESITMLSANRVPSIYQNGVLIDILNARLTSVGPQIETLRTDISGIGFNLRNKADIGLVTAMAYDIARLKDKADLPDDHVDYAADLFLTEDESDKTALGYNARIFRGLRFPPTGAPVVVPIKLANTNDPALIVEGGMALPKYTDDVRISVVDKNSEYPLTNTTTVTKEARSVREARQVSYVSGSESITAEIGANGQATVLSLGAYRGGEVPSNAVQTQTWSYSYPGYGTSYLASYSVPKYSTETYYETRTEWVQVTKNVTGSFTAQSFLNSQEGYFTGVNLFFSQKAATGDVRVMLVDCDPAGRPLFQRVLEEQVLPAADIKIYPTPTPVKFKPAHLVKGGRYAIVLASSAPHFICQVKDNKFAQGALFYYQDDNFVQAAAEIDMAIEIKFAKFASAYQTIALEPLELSGGIDSIIIKSDVALPHGTALDYQIRVNNEWRSIKDGADGTNILINRPNLVQFRVVMIGTTDAMPAMGLDIERSEVTLIRPSSAMLHVSKARTLAAPTNEITVRVKMRNWDPALHQLSCDLMTGVSYTGNEAADATSTKEEADGVYVRTFVFNVTAVSTFKIKLTGAINGSAKWFHIEERADIEF